MSWDTKLKNCTKVSSSSSSLSISVLLQIQRHSNASNWTGHFSCCKCVFDSTATPVTPKNFRSANRASIIYDPPIGQRLPETAVVRSHSFSHRYQSVSLNNLLLTPFLFSLSKSSPVDLNTRLSSSLHGWESTWTSRSFQLCLMYLFLSSSVFGSCTDK